MKESDNNVFDGIAFSISLIAIEACLAINILFFILSIIPHPDYSQVVNSPWDVSVLIDVLLFVLLLTKYKSFELVQFKAFACAGFFGYMAYCDNANMALPICMWLLIGLLTRRLGAFITSIVAVLAIGCCATYNFLQF